MRFFVRLLLLAALPAVFARASAQGWKPTKDVEFVIPFGLGGGADLMARVIHKIIVEEKLVPVPIALVNKPGGGGAAGIGYVAASRKADPHTLILINGSTQITPILNPQAKTLTEVKPVMNMMLDDFLLFVRADAPWKTAADFVKDAKSQAGEERRLLHRRHHRRDGGDRALQVDRRAVQHGELQQRRRGAHRAARRPRAGLDGQPARVHGPAAGRQVRALGVVRDKRFPGLKDVPTFQEQGIKTPNFQMWRGIAIPKDAPDAARAYWEGVMAKVNASPQMQKYYEDNVAQAATIPGKKFDAFLANQEKLYRDLLGK